MIFRCFWVILIPVILLLNLSYASPPENILTGNNEAKTLAGPEKNNNGFIIKQSNTNVENYIKEQQTESAAQEKALEDYQKGIYPVLHQKPDPYGLDPNTNN